MAIMRQSFGISALAVIVGLGFSAPTAYGQTFTGSFVNSATGNLDRASATFSVLTIGVSSYLDVRLTNTSTFAGYGNNDLLNGIFWGIAGAPTLTPVFATTGPLIQASNCSAAMVATCSGATVDVGGEFGFQFSPTGYSGNVVTTGQYGIGASGYSSVIPNFGGGNTSPFGASAPNLGGPTNVGGPDFSIVGPNYSTAASTNSVQGQPLINQTVLFRFLLPSGTSTVNVDRVIFAYGTNPDATTGGTVPEPTTLGVLAVGLAGFAAVRRRRTRR